MIEVRGLTRFYGEKRALHDVSFDVQKGEVLGLLGPNAAGKNDDNENFNLFHAADKWGSKCCRLRHLATI